MKLIRLISLMCIALLCYGCQGDEVLMDNAHEQKSVATAIGFEQGFVDNVTRANLNLSNYATTMGVWGYRNPNTDNECVFNNQLVSFDQQKNIWTYNPLKYWDTASTYDFYAYSPYDADVTLALAPARAYNINKVSLSGINLQETASATEKNVFKDTGDTDLLIDRKGAISIPGSARQMVQFQMQHILSKINVRIRFSEEMAAAIGSNTITLDQLTVGELASQGSFSQKLSHTPTAQEKDITEWTLLPATQITLSRNTPCAITKDYSYVLESLVMPQTIDADDELSLVYTIHYAAHDEKFTFKAKLRDMSADLQQFISGWNYTISLIIDSESIHFTADLAAWADNYNE